MSAVGKWWTRVTAAVAGAMLTLVVPVHAWAASNGMDDVAIEAARRRRRGGLGIFGLFGGVCCLLVVGAIVLVVVLILRRRKKP